jgi:serine/threonine-protein kinase HipA
MVNPIHRRSKNRKALNVWMNGQLVGTWQVYKNRPHQLQYADSWLDSPNRRVLSLSMPFWPGNRPIEGELVENFFDNLLPDNGEIRRRIQRNFKTKDTSPYELLAEIGRDCVGAIQLLVEDQEPSGWNKIEARPLSILEVEKHLKTAITTTLPGERKEDFRISIAGAQEKTALLWHNNQWHVPIGATPTTHIMKLPLGLVGNMQADMSSSIENEWLCSKIIQAYGIEIADCEISQFGKTKALVVKRFDRQLSKEKTFWLRLPQEDMCQALGVPPSMKYESDGGPGMADILKLLRASNKPKQDRITFYKAQILFWMLAATDGHAKNFSIFHEAANTFRMTPLYDVLSTWPIIGNQANHLSWHKARSAMAFRSKNVHYKLKEILPRHFYSVAEKLGLGGEIKDTVEDILEKTPVVISNVTNILPKGFPMQVADSIITGLKESAEKIQRYSKL